MRLCFTYPAARTSRPIDPGTLYTSPRGLTGSEGAWIHYALQMAERGHTVDVFGAFTQQLITNQRLAFYPEELLKVSAQYHATIAFMGTQQLRDSRTRWGFVIANEQCNDVLEFDGELIDLFCPLSSTHARHLWPQVAFPREFWRVMPNGVDTSLFVPLDKQPGKVVWASSHDRGLHHLLGIWPEVKRRVPHAELHVFYDPHGLEAFSEVPDRQGPVIDELKARSCYTLEAIRRLGSRGVVFRGSVSRQEIQYELGTAEVMAYPCDPVRANVETFGTAVLEAMSAGCVPVLCFADAFNELWSDACPGVLPPFEGKRELYRELLVSVLTQEQNRLASAARCRAAAERYTWMNLAMTLERTIDSRGAAGFRHPVWE